ncbi:type II toxin-antitoxin system VapC family toxin [Sphingomonas sp. dw_22]|uniref:type II toxin-antitoxin system VapC family toxin n=1 Tax=Sphingomonas sp. dw_22 TaxID=2721175 RepID=UPI001BD3F4E5|nr:type II toxin-antitoxin system VapC family toxin [Sphingomonas sp. dw_22]
MADGLFLLDSDICIYLLNNASPTLSARVADQSADTLFVSAVSLAEIAVGYGANAQDAPDLAAFVANIPVLAFDETAARIYGTLPFKRARFDRLIAAHALAVGMTLITNNPGDFADIPGLKIENWTL